jgi:arginyl-tRNA synthetase
MTESKTIYAAFSAHIAAALDALEAAGTLPSGLNRAAITVEPPRDPSHGDLATNAAMVLAKPAGTNPRALAEALVAELAKVPGWPAPRSPVPASSTCASMPSAWIAELRAIGALWRRIMAAPV